MDTQHLVQALRNLFNVVARIAGRTGRNLAMHGAGQCGVHVVRRLNLSMGGVRVAYHHLSEQDKAVVDEAVICLVGFADQYLQHHKQNSDYRNRLNSPEELFRRHVDEIWEAVTNTAVARSRAYAFDHVAGNPQRTSLFTNHDLRKQLVFAVIDELCSQLDVQT